MKKNFLFSIFILIIASTSIYAHKGRTDSHGGHYDTSDGTYHYHSGKYANTGDYTAPVEEGGKKIEDVDIEKEEKETQNKQTKSIDEKEKEELEKQIKYKSDSIAKQNKEIQSYKKIINDLEEQRIRIFIIFIIILIITNMIFYKIGMDKD